MASVRVRLFHELRAAAGNSEVAITADNVGELLRTLVDKYGEPARSVLFDQKGNIRQYAFFYLNNILQKPLDVSTRLRDGDVVLVIPPVSGG